MIKLKNILTESKPIPKAVDPLQALELQIEDIAADVGESVGRRLGAAANGIAYKTKSGKVLKITGDYQEVAAAIRLRNRYSRPLHHVATAYGAHLLTDFKYVNQQGRVITISDSEDDNSKYFLLVLPFVNVVSEEEGRYWDEIQFEFFDRSLSNEQVLNYAKRIFSPTQLEIMIPFLNRVLPQRASILKDFDRAGIKSVEAHGGNIGFDDHGRFVHYDYWITNPNKESRYYWDTSGTNMDVQGPKYTTDGIDTPGDPDM